MAMQETHRASKEQEVAVIDANNTDCYPTGGFTASACSCKVASTGMEVGAFEFQHRLVALTAARK